MDKKRSPNFTKEEREILLSIVENFKNVIESKKIDAYYVQKKKEAWATVTKIYNNYCTTGPRDVEKLKHFYYNIRHRARKPSANESLSENISENIKESISELQGTIIMDDDDYDVQEFMPVEVELMPNEPVANKSIESLTKTYLKKKIQLTVYQKRNEILKLRNEKKNQENRERRHELELKILQKQLDNLEQGEKPQLKLSPE